MTSLVLNNHTQVTGETQGSLNTGKKNAGRMGNIVNLDNAASFGVGRKISVTDPFEK